MTARPKKLAVVVHVDGPDPMILFLMRVLSRQVTGTLEVKRMPGLQKPIVQMPGLDRYIAQPILERIGKDVLALIERYHELEDSLH